MNYPNKFSIIIEKVGEEYVVYSPELPFKIADDEDVKAVEKSVPLALEAWVNMTILRDSPRFFSFVARILQPVFSFIFSRKIKYILDLRKEIAALNAGKQAKEIEIREYQKQIAELENPNDYALKCLANSIFQFMRKQN